LAALGDRLILFNKRTGVEAFASDPEGNGLMVVKVILNQITNQPAD